jgi:hypothetical protein
MNRLTHVALATMAVAMGFASAASADHPQREGVVRQMSLTEGSTA